MDWNSSPILNGLLDVVEVEVPFYLLSVREQAEIPVGVVVASVDRRACKEQVAESEEQVVESRAMDLTESPRNMRRSTSGGRDSRSLIAVANRSSRLPSAPRPGQ